MKPKKPWLKPNGTPLPDSTLKPLTQSWDTKTWAAYLQWYEKPCRETLLRPATYDRVCEGRTQTLHEELDHRSDEGLTRYCEDLLESLPSLEAKVLRLYFFEGMTELEIAARLKRSQCGIHLIKKRAISKLSAGNPDGDVIAIQIMRGLISQNEREVPSPWDASCPLSLRQNRAYHPENWRFELDAAPAFLRQALRGLSETQRRVVYLRFWVDGSVSAIARELGAGVNVIQEICEAAVFQIKSRLLSEIEIKQGVPSCA